MFSWEKSCSDWKGLWTWNWIWFTWQLQRCPRADILCLVIQWCLTLCDPMDYIAGQAPQNPWRFSRQEYWNGLPCPPPGDLPNPRIKLRSPTVWVDSLPSEPRGKPKNTGVGSLSLLQGTSWPRNRARVSCIVGGFFTSWATREARFKGSWHKKSAWIMFYCWTGQLGRKKRLTMTKAEGFSVNHRKFSLFLYQLRWQLHLWSRGSTRRLETICSTHVLKQCSGLMYLLFPAAFRGCLSGSSKLFLSW